MHARQAITTPVNQDRPHAINVQWTAAAKTRLKNLSVLTAVAHQHRIGGRQHRPIGDRALQDGITGKQVDNKARVGITTGSLLRHLIVAGQALRRHGNQLSMARALRHHGNQLRMVRAATHTAPRLQLWAVDKESRIVSNNISFEILINFMDHYKHYNLIINISRLLLLFHFK